MNATHVQDYLRRTGDDAVIEKNVTEDPEKGFCTYDLYPKALVIGNLYGDGAYWLNLVAAIARAQGKQKVMGVVRDKARVRLFTRKYKFRVVGYVLEKEISY